MASSHSTLQPAKYGGYGRQTGAYGGLEGVEFAARCPPDIQPGTRVVAVCGIPSENAGPAADGWFYSDMFLFYQMLRSRAKLPNQLWLSCSSPKDLIDEHEHYLHGAADGDPENRRVVMDRAMLPKNEFAAGFRVFQPKELLERFLATLRSEISEAARNNQHVLVLIFGHGEEKQSGVFIGCNPSGANNSWMLTQRKLAAVLDKNVKTTLVLTSCHSGGWIMKPNVNEFFDRKPAFNHTFLTAAGHDNESWSWNISDSIGRQAGGSVFATALLNSIAISSEKEQTLRDGTRNSEGKLVRVRENDEDDGIFDSFAGLTQQIVSECRSRPGGSLWEEHKFSFAVQDDLWAKSWRGRTGLPLVNYKERWESLPIAPVGINIYDIDDPMAGSLMTRSLDAHRNMIRAKAIRHMGSKPGNDRLGGNTSLHPGLKRLIQGVKMSTKELFMINEALEYRMGLLKSAELYCEILQIGVPESRRTADFDSTEWQGAQHEAKQGDSPLRSKAAIDILERFNKFRGPILRMGIFDSPISSQGLPYSKPADYLAARMAESRFSVEEVQKKLMDLQQSKLEGEQIFARSPRGQEILDKPEIKSLRRSLYSGVSTLRYRLRSLSPHKRVPMDGPVR